MTFKHKLSARLALLKDALPLVAVLLASCEFALRVAGSDADLSVIHLSPTNANLQPNQMIDFSVVGLNQNGDTVDFNVLWTVTSGSIVDAGTNGRRHYGRYRAGADTGNVKVIAKGRGGELADTANVLVTLVSVASVSISPPAATIGTGASAPLVATARDSAGNALPGRPVTWTSGAPAVATVNSSGVVTGIAVGSATITATSEGQNGTAAITVVAAPPPPPPPPPAPVASVTVSPASATVPVGFVGQLTATPKDANGTPLTGRSVSWTSGNTAVATVSGTGLVTGVVAGSATITATSEGISGSSAITVIAPPPPGSSCLTQTGPTIVVSGVQTTWSSPSMADNTKVDASTALFSGGANVPVRISGGSRICFSGGAIVGNFPPSTTWSRMHDTYAMAVKVASASTIENFRIFDYGDGPTMDAQGGANWTIRGAYLKYMRDDCIENDFLVSGTIDDSFLDGCYGSGVSSREFTSVLDGSNNVVVMRNSLVRLQAMDGIYSGSAPDHHAFWKWSNSIGPKVALYNNVFRADRPSASGNGAGMYMAPPTGKLADCENNVMVWLGTGSFPEPLPTTFNGKPCFRLLTGAEGLQYWNDAAAQWKANHPWTLVDVAAPIVSLFSPGMVGSTTLTGTVSLTATAVDDQDVASVRLQLNGQNIGAELPEAPLTKFSLSWDSRSVPNGTYTLTATAVDTAGRTTTSAGVTVTISN